MRWILLCGAGYLFVLCLLDLLILLTREPFNQNDCNDYNDIEGKQPIL